MGRYTSIWGDRYVFVVRQRGSMKINRYVYFRLDLCVRTQQMSGNLTVYVMQKREKY